MNCPQCTGEMVKAQATNFGEQYDYCRSCKKELKEMILGSSAAAEKPEGLISGTAPRLIGWGGIPHHLVLPKHMYDPMTKKCFCGSRWVRGSLEICASQLTP